MATQNKVHLIQIYLKKILIVLILIFSECAVNGRSSQLIDTDFISLGTFIHSFTDSFIHMPNQFA